MLLPIMSLYAGSPMMRLENFLVYPFPIAEQLIIKQCKQKRKIKRNRLQRFTGCALETFEIKANIEHLIKFLP